MLDGRRRRVDVRGRRGAADGGRSGPARRRGRPARARRAATGSSATASCRRRSCTRGWPAGSASTRSRRRARGRPAGSSPISWSCSTSTTRSPTRRPQPVGPPRARGRRRSTRRCGPPTGTSRPIARLGGRRRERLASTRVADRVWSIVAERLASEVSRSVGRRWSARSARSRCCSAPRRDRCTRTCSSAAGAPASKTPPGRSPRRWSAPTTTARSGGRHPDVVEFEPVANAYSVDEVREGIIPEVHRSPIEGERKVVIVLDAERLRAHPDPAARRRTRCSRRSRSRRPRAVLLLVTAAPGELLDTIRSRCQRVDLGALDVDDAARRARARRDRARARPRSSARLAGGQMAAGPAARRPLRAAARRVRRAPRARRRHRRGRRRRRRGSRRRGAGHARPGCGRRTRPRSTALDAEIERRRLPAARRAGAAPAGSGSATSARTAGPGPRRCSRGSPRSSRCTATRWPTGAPPINPDRDALVVGPGAAAEALDACAEARRAFEFNPNEGLLLERLMLHLPAVARGPRLGRLPPSAGIAQSVEQLTRNEQVRGSNPFPGSEASDSESRVKEAKAPRAQR